MKNIIINKTIIVAVFIISFFTMSCQEEDFQMKDMEEPSFEPISLSEIPSGVIPLEFESHEEAKEYFKKLQEEREKIGETIISYSNEQDIPRLKGGGVERHPISGALYGLFVSINYDYVGGNVTISSYYTGFTFSIGWEQYHVTYYWSDPYINYTIHGVEIWYIVIQGIGEIYRNPQTFSGSYKYR